MNRTINALLTLSLIAALAMAVLAAGCSTTQPPACNPDAPAGSWTTTTDAGSYTLTLNTDGSCSYQGVKTNGNPIGFSCTWKADSTNITFTLSDGSTDAPQPYWIVDGDLVIGETTWTAECGK